MRKTVQVEETWNTRRGIHKHSNALRLHTNVLGKEHSEDDDMMQWCNKNKRMYWGEKQGIRRGTLGIKK